MTKLRVLFVPPVPDFKGGAEHSLFDLIANPDIEAHLAVPAEGPLSERASSLGVPTHVVEYGSVLSIRRPFKVMDGVRVLADALSAARQLNAIAQRNKIDIIHTNGLKSHIVAAIARMLRRRVVVVHVRDIAYTGVEKLVWKLLPWVSSRVVLVSRACWPAETLPNKVVVVANGIPVPDSAPPARVGRPIRIAFVGRIHPHKGLHDLLDWLAEALAAGVDAHLAVRGQFAPETPHYRGQIEAQIVARGLSEHVRFDGYVSDASKLYQGVDIVCVPSFAPEPFGRAVIEPMARGMPVLATPVGGMAELFIEGESGFFVRNAADFRNALAKLAAEPAFVEAMGQAAHRRCRDLYSLEALHKKTNAVYAELASS